MTAETRKGISRKIAVWAAVGFVVGLLLIFGMRSIVNQNAICVPVSLYGKRCGEIDINCCPSSEDEFGFYLIEVGSFFVVILCPVIFGYLAYRRDK